MSPVFLKLIFKHKFSHKKILHNKNFSILFEYTLYKKSLFKNTFLPKKEKKMGLKQGLNITIKNYFLTDTKNLLVNKKIEEFLCLQKYKSNPKNSLNTRYFYLREPILKYKPIKLSILISSLFFFFFHLFFIFYNRLSILTWQLLIFKKQKYFLKPMNFLPKF